MGIDYCTLEKEELIARLKKLEGEKRYGLIWEEKPEYFDTLLEDNYPTLKNIYEKDLITNDENMNLFIEGENLHALALLHITHRASIDMIYIDPPYNTGNKDFFYHDRYVDKDDAWRHSKWLSFMSRRLKVARDLLKPEGLIFISIDDNEMYQLKLLMDDIFGDSNFIANLPTIMNLKGNQDEFGFAGTHEYTLVYAKNKKIAEVNMLEIDEDEVFSKWDEDEDGLYKQGANLKATGKNAPREKRPNLFYPILFDKNGNISTITKEEHLIIYNKDTKEGNHEYAYKLKERYEKLGYTVLLPITNGKEMSWRWSREKIEEGKDIIVVKSKDNISLYKKQRPELSDLATKKPKSFLYKPEYSSGNGTEMLKNIFKGEKVFNNPKPIELIKDIIKIGSNNDSIILDFFAGSGTTAHAIAQLNAEDINSNRKFILVTNNEQGICENVCYPRIKAFIDGYENLDGSGVQGLNISCKYYKTDSIPKNKNMDSKKITMAKAVFDLLCIKEECFRLKEEHKNFRIYEDSNKVLGIYTSFLQTDFNTFKEKISQSSCDEKVIYNFDFSDTISPSLAKELGDKIKIKSMPSKIIEILDELRK